MLNMHRLAFVDLSDERGIGLIISWPSGVVYSNQTGGTTVLLPQLEGAYVPLSEALREQQRRLFEYFTGPKWRGSCDRGVDEETADFIDAVLQTAPAAREIRVDRARLRDSHEAWVYVRIGEPPEESAAPIFSGFGPARGVLTWMNSD